MSQVKPWGPLAATSPRVSNPTNAQTVKKKRSKRRSDFFSLVRSSSARVVVSSVSAAIRSGTVRLRGPDAMAQMSHPCTTLWQMWSAPKEVEQPELLLGSPPHRSPEAHAQRVVEAHEAPGAQRVA